MNAEVMNRYDATLRLLERVGDDDAIVGGIGNTNFDLWAAGPRDRNFYMLGSMGLAVPIALGVALAQPQRRVIALEGDGSILMQLGAFATVAKLGQKNLGTLIMDNGCYQITGSQPTASAEGTDLEAVARACGLEHTATVASAAALDAALDRFWPLQAPWVIVIKIDSEPPRGTTERDPQRIRMRFMDALKLD
ncbi:MAG TPA: thiamine pyrophosphate-dependent enzyme [Allosphingosinicella sp.]|nr:thiamine pyrophosphate-dependent enzyme [Allosphingosinicella sp.]